MPKDAAAALATKSTLDRLLSVELTQKGVEAICRLPGRPRRDVADRRQAGLQLRISGDTVAWHFRTEAGDRRRRAFLGVAPDLSIANARQLAGAAMQMIRMKAGEPDEAWVAAKRVELGIDKAIEVKPTRSAERLTFAEARDAYLTEVLRVWRPKTHTAYRHCLTHPSLDHLANEEVANIRRERLARIVEDVHASGTEPMAKSIADTLRTMWTFLEGDTRIKRSGVTVGEMTRLKEPRRTRIIKSDEKQERTPSLDEVGYLLAAARHGFLDICVGPAIQLLVLTVQRRFSVVLAKRSHLTDDEGFRIWNLPPENLKTGDTRRGPRAGKVMPHELPLPPSALAAMEKAAEATGESEWFFPQVRPKKEGMAVSHLHESTVTHALQELPGVRFSPHDMRRTFTTAMEDIREGKLKRFPKGEAAKVLDHGEGRDHSDVTSVHYDRHRALMDKYDMLEAWQNLIEPIAAKYKDSVDWEEFWEQAKANRKARRTKARKGQTKVAKPFP
jgi:integrase